MEHIKSVMGRIDAAKPDCVVVESGDWTEGAKDLCNPALALELGDHLRTLGIRSVVVGPLATMHPRTFSQRYPALVVGAPGGSLLAAVAGESGVLSGGGQQSLSVRHATSERSRREQRRL